MTVGKRAEYAQIRFGPYCLVASQRLLTEKGVPVPLGGRALDILICLADRAGEVVPARDLRRLVWQDVLVEDGNLRTQLTGLKKALKDGVGGARYIINLRGQGYSFVAPMTKEYLVATGPVPVADRDRIPPRLPDVPRRIFGRERTIEKLSTVLGSRRLVTVVGAGGIGKTAVATLLAHAMRERLGPERVFFVDLSGVTTPADAPHHVASALGYGVDSSNPDHALRVFLSGKKALLVLDGCEHVIDGIAPLAEWLIQNVPQLSVLTTSREALRVVGESVFLLPPLSVPEQAVVSARETLSSPALQLFVERAMASGYAGDLSDADATIIADMCRRLDGIALAIEFAASRVGTYGIPGTAELLDRGGVLLLPGKRSSAPRHQTLEALLDWSFALLTQEERRILIRLATFDSYFTLDSAHQMISQTGDSRAGLSITIASLVDKSLVVTSLIDEIINFRLLDATRAYALAKSCSRAKDRSIPSQLAAHEAACLTS